MSKKYTKNCLFLAAALVFSAFCPLNLISSMMSPSVGARMGSSARAERYAAFRKELPGLIKRGPTLLEQTALRRQEAVKALREAKEALEAAKVAEKRAAEEKKIARIARKAERIRKRYEKKLFEEDLLLQAQRESPAQELQPRNVKTKKVTVEEERAAQLNIPVKDYRRWHMQVEKDLKKEGLLSKNELKRGAMAYKIEQDKSLKEILQKKLEGLNQFEKTMEGVLMLTKILEDVAGLPTKNDIKNAKEKLIQSRIESRLRAKKEGENHSAPQYA